MRARSRLIKIEDRIFTNQRLLVYGSIVAVSYAIGLGWMMFRNGWFFGSESKPCMDFSWMWVSGTFVFSIDPVRVYDPFAVAATWKALAGSANCPVVHNYFNYPPTYLFITYLLSLMPYSAAYFVWMGATLTLYLGAIYMITRRLAAVIGGLTPFSVIPTFILGHNAFLTAGLIGTALGWLERRPWLAGIALGVLTYKPQFGLLFPVALLASRNWRALASATGASLVFAGAATLAIGYQAWPAFIASLYGPHSSLLPGGGLVIHIQSVYGFFQWLDAPAWISWTLHLIVALIVTIIVYFVWAKPNPSSLKAAIICVGSVAVTPYVLGYDFLIVAIGVCFLVNDGLERRFLPGERAVILICLISLIYTPIPLCPLMYLALIVLIIRRIFVCRGETVGGRNRIEVRPAEVAA